MRRRYPEASTPDSGYTEVPSKLIAITALDKARPKEAGRATE